MRWMIWTGVGISEVAVSGVSYVFVKVFQDCWQIRTGIGNSTRGSADKNTVSLHMHMCKDWGLSISVHS